jgi:peptidoglycan/xylan/chitin deacetylase (PgdA/CDA1 family)
VESLTTALTKTAFGTLNMIVPNRLSILIFHRVHASADSIFPNEPDARSFDHLMRFIAKSFNVISLGEAATGLAAGRLPSRALVITFDDGYADNAEVALPILRRYGLVATFFISTGFLDGGRMWNDSVIECLRNTRKTNLDLEEFALGRVALNDAGARRHAIEALLPRIKYLTLAERQEAIARLQGLCDLSTLPTDLMMNTAQVRELHAAGMECGGHTVNHPILQSLSLNDAREEIAQGKRHLESIIDAPIKVFAYPNGKPDQDYSAQHARLVEELGFSCAVTTAKGAAQPGDDLFQIPRYSPWGSSLAVWATRLLINQAQRGFDLATQTVST